MRIIMAILILPALAGCRTLPLIPFRHSHPATLAEAELDLAEGDFYEARRMTEKILEENPANPIEDVKQCLAVAAAGAQKARDS